MKKIFTLMVLMMMAPWVGWGQEVWDGTANTDWYNDNPNATEFTINTAEELAGLAELVNDQKVNFLNKTINLNADITLNANSEDYKNWATTPPDNKWTTIGGAYYSPKFSGTFNGNNHTIKGVYIKNTNKEDYLYVGLFGSGSIQNLKVIQSYIEKEGNAARIFVGGITGGGGNISNCGFDGLIVANISGTVSELGIGGICADIYNTQSAQIESCYTSGEIKVSLNNIQLTGIGLCYIAGIGMAKEVSNSYNTADISVNINGVKGNNGVSMNTVTISGIGNAYDIASCYNTGDMIVSGGEAGNENTVVVGLGGILGSGGNAIQYCYSNGIMTTSNLVKPTSAPNWSNGNLYGEGSILGLDQSMPGYPDYQFQFLKDYYLDNTKAVGGNVYNASISYEGKEGLNEATEIQFAKGEVAWLLRDAGFGQSLDADGVYQNEESSPVLLAFDENKGKEVYKLTLNVDETEYTIYRNAIESNLLSEEAYKEIMADAAEGQDLVWTTTDNKVFSGNSYKVTKDETLSGELKGVYKITTMVTPEGAGEISNIKKTAVNGEDVSFSLGITDGYKLLSVTMNEETLVDKNADGIYTFTMPAKDVTITATFEKIETGGDDDDEGGIGTKRYQLFLADRDFYLNDKYDAEGLVLFSRHDKRYAEVGGSFTVYYEKDGEVNAGDYRIFWSKSANGEYKEVKFDEVSGYYQIRNVQSDVYVKIYGRDGFPVSNEAIEATEARAYAQANKIIVVTHEPMDVQIVSMAGAVVGNAKVTGQQEFGNLTEGVYIVRLGDTVVKLQVRN